MELIVGSLLPLAVVVIMFSLGLGLTPSDFRRILTRPKAFFIGAFNQVILLPAIAYLVILVFGFTTETAVGIMLLAACPGGAVSNIITKLASWDVALSVTLTATFSLTCIITLPLILYFAVSHFMGEEMPDINIAGTAVTAFLLTALPICIGIAVRAGFPKTTEAISPVLGSTAIILFASVILAAIASNWQIVTDNLAELGLALLALIVVLSVIGYTVSRLLGASDSESKTIAIETGVQNGALALAIAGLLVADGPAFSAFGTPAALYGVVWLATALPAFLIVARFGSFRPELK